MDNFSIPVYNGIPSNLIDDRFPFKKLNNNDEELSVIKEIISDVKQFGDDALVKYTEKYDSTTLTQLKVSKEEINEAYNLIDRNILPIFHTMKNNVGRYETELISRNNFTFNNDGVEIVCRTVPLNRIGCYIPGGKASYPSSVFMTIVPAQVAGVKHISIVSPPRNGQIDPYILVAADICGITDIYKIGGSQAIAALAFGTKSIEKVDMIVGPGNKYVTEAKKIVSKIVLIDNPAGPSEIVVLADENANPDFIVSDLIAQAEHGADGKIYLVTPSKVLIERVESKLRSIIEEIPRSEFVKENLQLSGGLILVNNIEEGIEFVNSFGPEHLEVLIDDVNNEILSKITNCGLLLVNPYTPVAASDYIFGTNHILPTGGYSKIYSPYSSLDCVKLMNIVKTSRNTLKKLHLPIMAISTVEKLYNHGLSVQRRFSDDI